jgi:hypothetical protein
MCCCHARGQYLYCAVCYASCCPLTGAGALLCGGLWLVVVLSHVSLSSLACTCRLLHLPLVGCCLAGVVACACICGHVVSSCLNKCTCIWALIEHVLVIVVLCMRCDVPSVCLCCAGCIHGCKHPSACMVLACRQDVFSSSTELLHACMRLFQMRAVVHLCLVKLLDGCAWRERGGGACVRMCTAHVLFLVCTHVPMLTLAASINVQVCLCKHVDGVHLHALTCTCAVVHMRVTCVLFDNPRSLCAVWGLESV